VDRGSQLFPLASRHEAVEIHERNAVDHGVADLHDPGQPAQDALVDLVLAQQFGVIEKISQEPASFHIAFGVQ